MSAAWVTLLDQQCQEWRHYAQYCRARIDADTGMPRDAALSLGVSAISYEQAANDLDRLVAATPHFEVVA